MPARIRKAMSEVFDAVIYPNGRIFEFEYENHDDDLSFYEKYGFVPFDIMPSKKTGGEI